MIREWRLDKLDEKYNNNMNYLLNRMIIGEESVDRYDEFLNEYGQKSDEELYQEISKVQADVSNEAKKIHVRNLERLSRMEGFVDDDVRRRVEKVKGLIKIEESGSRRYSRGSAQYFYGTSLLLWFLLVTALFRKPYYRYGYRRRPYY